MVEGWREGGMRDGGGGRKRGSVMVERGVEKEMGVGKEYENIQVGEKD